MTGSGRAAIRKPALVAMAFAAQGPGGTGDGRRALECLWEACRELGMTEQVPGTGLPAEHGGFDRAESVVPGLRFLSAAYRPDPQAVYQAYSFADRDVTGLVCVLAPNDTAAGPEQWADIHDGWERAVRAAGPPDVLRGLLGRHHVFEALVEGPADDGFLREAVRAHAPAGGHGRGAWWAGFDRTDQGFSVWREQTGTPETPGRFYVLAPSEREAALDEWVWYAPGEHRLRPLARYLMHMSKIRYQAQRYDERDSVPSRIEESDRWTNALLRELDSAGGRQSLEGVVRTAAQLDSTQTSPQGMLWTITRQRQFSNTVAAGMDNLLPYTPAVRRIGTGPSWPESDRAFAERLIQRVDDDRLHLEAARERADSVRAQARAATDRAMSDERSLLTLIQTSVLGAVLTGLAAVQTLEYELPLPKPLQSPLIAVLTAFALALPVSVLRWTGVALGVHRHRWLDRVVAGLAGAAVGWLAVTGYGVVWGAGPTQAVWTLPGAVAAAGAAVLAVDRLLRRSSGATHVEGAPSGPRRTTSARRTQGSST
ncbi:CATRA conflict system CASPASE/TPR repeat-associated protein [Streptomyces sp. NPDC059166]|uniref:CATRA conflict system CASPASE/TPR repeat-associated protein n=1 Tax=Streptomyces sp. NPDC059166 TaxID=3346752 RepID=UPI0036A083CF